jgi:ATP-dependent 26S proteasome regulatory subunit
LDLRIIATTNAKKVQIDEAILRPGRLCVYCSVGHLPAKQAGEVFRRLTGSEQEFGEKTTLAEVYRLARKDGWSPKEKNVSAAGQYL